MKICEVLLLPALLITSKIEFLEGVVEISPSESAPVCRAGDQLKLTCSTSRVLQTWKFTVISESGAPMTFTRSVSSGGSTGVDSEPLIINSTISFVFSRLSREDSLPLISRMMISPVTEGLNATRVNCLDGITSESATTTIIIGGIQNQGINIKSHSEWFTSHEIVVILEWAYSISGSHTQQLAIAQNIGVNVVPAIQLNGILVFIENTSVILMLQYNTLYNVSITQLQGICGQLNQTAFIELNYSRCSNPMKLVNNDNIIIEGYEDPALEGDDIRFICSSESMFSGPHSSTCMRNGEWKPHPNEVACEGIPDPAIAMLQTALISVTILLIILSILMFLVGFATGGYYFSQRWRKSASATENESPSNSTKVESQEGVDVKKNVAYIDLDPE